MIDHFFPDGATLCIHCNTPASQHLQTVCPGPQGQPAETLRPEPTRREYAVDAIDVIHARIAELEAERQAVLNRPAEEAGAPTPPYVVD